MKKLLLLIPIILLTVLFFVFPRVFKIKDIECKSQYGPCSSQLESSLISNKNTSYLLAKKNITKTLADSKDVSQFSIRFMFPAKFLVEVIESKAIVAIDYEGKFYLLDKQGVVLAIVDQNNLPVIHVSGFDPNFSVNQKMSAEFVFVSNAMNKIYLVYNVNEATMTENQFSFVLSSGKTIIFPTLGNSDVLFGSLQIILSRLNRDFAIIDLRYKNPVLR
ncbi:MAG: cell division protein FtsQ/DivIB [Patescibacteria group bacterium]